MGRLLRNLLTLVLATLILATLDNSSLHAQQAASTDFGLNLQKLEDIRAVVEDAIRKREAPGAVVLIGHHGEIVYREAFGNRALVPRRVPMTVTTIFDMASLTKVIATTPAVMQLFEQGKIRLEDPVMKYWPEFGANGKEQITILELMTHYSGLPPDLDLKAPWSGYETAMRMIVATKPIAPPGTRFIYSDINFETLGELVRRISGQPLDVYSAEHIFKPLGMKDTFFRPLVNRPSDRPRIAPTQQQFGATGPILWGEVHDPTSFRMGGVAGHAGLFSTADDLAMYAQMLLDGGSTKGVQILSPLTVEKMTMPQTPPGATALRGLGWDIASPFASNRGELFPVGSYGHTGFTGTSLWIDPHSQTYVIILTNRLHPDGKGDVVALREKIATLVAAALGPSSAQQILASQRSLTSHDELARGYRGRGLRNGNVETGIDVLEAERFTPLKGLRIGLITNHTGVDSRGRRTVDVLR
ncbi:MAG TPA: serine hydrolase, partial [Terriglobia bacterium]|nr:serine hydrolase [Terriglobia bacterium]